MGSFVSGLGGSHQGPLASPNEKIDNRATSRLGFMRSHVSCSQVKCKTRAIDQRIPRGLSLEDCYLVLFVLQ